MTTLYRDPNTGSFALPNSPGTINLGSAPSWNILGGGNGFNLPETTTPAPVIPTSRNVQSPTPLRQTNPSTISFTQALIQMLKDAQGRNDIGQVALTNQKNEITGLGINDAARNFSNPLLAPNDSTSLGRSAIGEFDPVTGEIKRQQDQATRNLSNITDLVKETRIAYDNEQERIQKAKDKADNMTFETPANISATEKKMQSIAGTDGYIDPAVWVQMKSTWKAHGGSAASFISNFKDYVNPLSYDKVGLGGNSELDQLQALFQ